MELVSAALLVYCLGIVPIQLSLWSDVGTCERVPTWFVDMAVDIFFMVGLPTHPIPTKKIVKQSPPPPDGYGPYGLLFALLAKVQNRAGCCRLQ
jgi:hypothetical protein